MSASLKKNKSLEKRLILTFIFFLIFFSLTFFFEPIGLRAAKGKINLNILLISIDTIRPDRLSCYDSRYVKIVNIDNLARRGLVFDRAFARTPLTLPSHVNMLTGLTPPYHGVHDNARFRLSPDIQTIAEYLKTRGYSTGAFVGAFPLDSRFGLNQGFDVYDDRYGTKARQEFFILKDRPKR